jgi:mRNA export factor
VVASEPMLTRSALSYDWYKGHSGVPPAGQPATRIMLHAVNKEEVQRKPKK